MTNIKLIVAYDGTGYFGWQKSAAGFSIEGVLQQILEKILKCQIILQAASRTDRGVHALGQVVNFFICNPIKDINKFQFQLNSLLPKDIRVLNAEEAHGSFHPTIDAVEKTYSYDISAAFFQMPCDRHYSWHVYHPLNVPLMQKGAELLVGTHDFQGFTNRKIDEKYTDHICTIQKISIIEMGEKKIRFIIAGNRFLYKMVRNLVGTLVYIGCKKLPVSVINELLMQKNRTAAGITSPANGLTLMNIKY